MTRELSFMMKGVAILLTFFFHMFNQAGDVALTTSLFSKISSTDSVIRY